ncbi:MAG: MarR family winged helix-turn-helix transcriptional regulator [Myxococcota bacterium]
MGWIDDLSTAWEREYPELDTQTFPPMVRLARLSVLIDAFQQQVLAPFGLSSGDYGVLAALRRAGAPYQLTPSKLYSRLQRSSGGMTKILKRLEERGLVERAPDPRDGRGSVVSLTEAGGALHEQVFLAYLEATQDLLDPLSETELKEADGMLTRLLDLFEGGAAR